MDQQKIGSFIKELRLEKKLTQEQLSELLGVSNRSVSRWENGKTLPDIDLLIELADIFGVEISELLSGERKVEAVDEKTEETLVKMVDYSNTEKENISKRIRIRIISTLILIFIYAVYDITNSDDINPFILKFVLGVVAGNLLVCVFSTSRYMARLTAAKQRLLKKIRKEIDKNEKE